MAFEKQKKPSKRVCYLHKSCIDLNREPLTNIFFSGGNRLVTASEEKKQDWNPANMLVLSVSVSRTFAVPKIDSQTPENLSLSMVAFVAQCICCNKWRIIPGEEDYEAIRANISRTSFICKEDCYWAAGMSCATPQVIDPNECAIWARDYPRVPKTPDGWKRILFIRSPGSTRFADVYYVPPIQPCKRLLKSENMVEDYIRQQPDELAEVDLEFNFCFEIPIPLQRNYVIPSQARSTDSLEDGDCSSGDESRDMSHPVLDLPPGTVKKKQRNKVACVFVKELFRIGFSCICPF